MGSGVVVEDRSAAAAAAEERLPLEGGRYRPVALLAARVAAALVLWSIDRVRLALLPRRRDDDENMLGMIPDGGSCARG